MTKQWTRLAPSPTGALHLGNAFSFVLNWLLARQNNFGIAIRIDDLETSRTKRDADKQVLEILQWLGLDWDTDPYYQSKNLQPYQIAFNTLAQKGLCYPCTCTRKEIEAIAAPHLGQHETPYPGTCAHKKNSFIGTIDNQPTTHQWRFRCPDKSVSFQDHIYHEIQAHPANEVGDFVIVTKVGLPSYQLATVVDDTIQGINHIVRGNDLLPSTARQLLLKDALGHTDPMHYYHTPLIIGTDGKRLAKRHGDTRISTYRKIGCKKEAILGLIAHWAGWLEKPQPCSTDDMLQLFAQYKTWSNNTTQSFTKTHDRWLTT